MKNLIRIAFETKTGRTIVAGILAAVAGYLQGAIEMPALVAAVIVGIQQLAQRHGVEKSGRSHPEGE